MEECDGDSNGKQVISSHVNDYSQANYNESDVNALHGLSELTNTSDSTLMPDNKTGSLPFQCHACSKNFATSSLDASRGNGPTGKDTDSCLPIDIKQEDGDDCDPAMWDGVVPIEVKGDIDDEDLVCEFCSPRLEAGDQLWKRNEEPFTSDEEWEPEGGQAIFKIHKGYILLMV